jgi:hypothetical protein
MLHAAPIPEYELLNTLKEINKNNANLHNVVFGTIQSRRVLKNVCSVPGAVVIAITLFHLGD